MANIKISQLPASTALAGTDLFPLVQGTVTNKGSIAALDGRYFAKTGVDAPGTELAYVELQTAVTSTATTAAGAVTVMSTPPIVLDGKPILATYYTPRLSNDTSNALQYVALWDGTLDLGVMGSVAINPSGAPLIAAHMVRRLTPAAGTHTFTIKLWANAGTGQSLGGTGGLGTFLPQFLRITKV